MKVQNISIFMGDTTKQGRENGIFGQQKSENSIFAGNKNQKQDNIQARKQQLQKNAMQVLWDAAGNEDKIDSNLEERRSKIKALQDSSKIANEELNKLDELIHQASEEHGVVEGSQEQKDMELLLKQQNEQPLNKTERKRLDEMGEKTEYQRQVLGYDSLKDEYRKQISKNQREIGMESASIKGTKLARLKSHAMEDAVNAKKDMVLTAAKELIGMMKQEAVEHIDEEQRKVQEEAEKKAEKQEEQDKKLEEAKLGREEAELELEKDRADAAQDQIQEQPTQGNTPAGKVPEEQAADVPQKILKPDSSHERLEAELRKIMQEEKLLEEELKGLAIDKMS